MNEPVDVDFRKAHRKVVKLPDNIAREIISFANTRDGELYVGIRDDGTIVGVENPDEVIAKLSRVIRRSILPDVMPFVQIRTVERDGKEVVKISVSIGTQRPYFLAREGQKPKGVFVRKESACIPLNEAEIRQMILETAGNSYEESRSLNQDLTFEALQREFSGKKTELDSAQMKEWKLIGEDGLYTGLALLLSDQCAHTFRIAVFQGTDYAVFRDRKEFSGSVLKQLEDVYSYISQYNKTKAAFDGLRRTDCLDYPEEAIREALLNSVIHRDYLFPGSTIVLLFDDHMEFVSLGGLVPGISMESAMTGAPVSRNPNLAAMFCRLGLAEGCGTGIRKILQLYEDSGLPPVFRAAEGVFSAELKNRNENHFKEETPPVQNQEKHKSPGTDVTDEICRLIAEKGESTRKDVEETLHVGSTKAYKLLKQLCDEGRLVQKLNGNRTTYILSRP